MQYTLGKEVISFPELEVSLLIDLDLLELLSYWCKWWGLKVVSGYEIV